MSNRKGFNEFLSKLQSQDEEIGFLLDTNVVIAIFDTDHRQKDLVRDFLKELGNICKPIFYSTITVKCEFMEFRRRFHLTEGLLDLVDEFSKGRQLTGKSKSTIQSQKGLLSSRKKTPEVEEELNIDLEPYKRFFNDQEIKKIKSSFRARSINEEKGWIEICELYLSEKIVEDEEKLDKLCSYLTTSDPEIKEIVFDNKNIEWKDATFLCGTTGMGYSDSMILNIFKVSNVKYLVTLDFDLIYGTSINAKEKTVLFPDKRKVQFKKILKKAPTVTLLPSGKK